jgi:hypothetical protein
LASIEMYDPSTNDWRMIGNLTEPRSNHVAVLTASGEVLFAGGLLESASTSAELFDPESLFTQAQRPEADFYYSLLSRGTSFVVTGSGFTSRSEAHGGQYAGAPSNSPMVQLMRVDNGAITWIMPDNFTDTDFESVPLPATMPVGPYRATIFVNGIPSRSKIVYVGDFAL